MRASMPLIVRGGLNRTFGSLAGFTALGLFSLGIYLLADAFAHPVDAEAAGVILAAFVIAIAMLLLAFIFKPRRFPDKEYEGIEQQRPHSPANQLVTACRNRLHNDLPYQRTFVDQSTIQPRTSSSARRAESPESSSLRESYGDEFDVRR